MKKINIIITIALITIISVFLLIRCKKQSRSTIEGTVIAYEYCTNNVKGYLIEVQKPEGIGENIVINETQYSNVVKTYSQPINSLHIGDQIMGNYQILTDTSICRVCEDLYQVYDVPEVTISFNN
jgi:hypothetical protein